MIDREYAIHIYCLIFGVEDDGGDAYVRGILDTIGALDEREQIALNCCCRQGKTFIQTGSFLGGVTGTNARMVFRKAVRKLRHASRKRNMSVKAIMEYRDKLLEDAAAKIEELYDQIDKIIQGAPVNFTTQAAINARKKSVCEIGFSSRVYNHLTGAGLSTVEGLLALDTLAVLEKRHGFGLKSRDEILSKMRAHDYGEWADRMEK